MRDLNSVLVGLMAGAAGVALCANAAMAQEVVADRDGITSAEDNNGEIIVTAQKRAESLQKVPISVGVITAETLDAKGIDRAIDAALQVPGVVFQQTDEARTASISIRGIGSNGVSEGFEPSVSAIIDGEVYARTTSLTQNVADVERVEVLRGPQGTLFGKNTSAGAVSVITKKPKVGETSGEIQVRMAEHEERTAKGFVNVPLGDIAAFRLNGFVQHIGGWLDNRALDADDLTHTKARGARAQLRLQPSDKLDVVIRGDISKSESNGTGTIHLSIPSTTAGNTIRNILNGVGQEIGPDSLTASANNTQYSNIENKGVSADISYMLGDYELRSQSFLRRNRLDENRDPDATPIDSGPLRFGGFVLADSFQQEIRLTSPKFDFGDFLIGAFYYDVETSRDAGNQVCTQLGSLTVDTGGVHATNRTYYDPVTMKVTDCQGAGISPYNVVNNFSTAVTRENAAIFGNVNLNITDQLKAFAGARYLTEKTGVRFWSSQAADTPDPESPFRGSRTDDAFIYRVGGQYFVTPDINVYASYSTGYKGATYNDTGGSTAASLSPGGDDYLEPEKSNQIEAGLRAQLFDRALTVNVTGFILRIKDFQERVSQFVDLNDDGIFDDVQGVTINAGEVESRGVEYDVSLRTPIQNLTLMASGAYTDAFYKDFGNNFLPCPTALFGSSQCFDPADIPGTEQFTDPTGRPLSRAPKWQHNISASYRPEFNDGSTARIELNYRGQSSFNFDLAGDPLARQKSYGVFDASVGFTTADKVFSFSVFGKNLFDKRYYSSILDQPAGFGGGYRAGVPRDALRYFGITAKVSY